jgi:aryl-alcohol dehydrogenase-like predicted oxidoreductase
MEETVTAFEELIAAGTARSSGLSSVADIVLSTDHLAALAEVAAAVGRRCRAAPTPPSGVLHTPTLREPPVLCPRCL